MIKLVYCVRRREDVSPEEFHRYWLEEHGPLARSFAEALQAFRYVQSHAVFPEANEMLRHSRGSSEPYDGITELWWRDAADFLAASTSEAGNAASLTLIADEATFIDFSRSSLFLTEEHEIFTR